MTSVPYDFYRALSVLATDADALAAFQSGLNTGGLAAGPNTVSVKDPRFGAKGDGVTDDLAAFVGAVAAATPGGRVAIPPGTYLLSSYINVPSGVMLIGIGFPTLKCNVVGRALRFDTVSQCVIDGIVFNGNAAGVSAGNIFTINNCSDIVIRNCRFSNTKGSLALTGTTTDCSLDDNWFSGSTSTSIELQGAGVMRNRVSRNRVYNGVGFGVWVAGGTSRNLIEGNSTYLNGIELVGITYDSWGNKVVGNHAEGCGDNGISVTGFQNTVVGNVCRLNSYDGIYVYGKQNTVTGNVCVNNGQNTGAQRSGITLGAASGGIAQLNTISGNFIDDDQTVPTQYYGIKVNASLYSLWVTSTVYSVGQFIRTTANNVYKCTVGGTSGATNPTHTSGSATDGGVTWLYVDTFVGGTSEPYGNTIAGNTVYRSASGTAVIDNTTNKSNTIFSAGDFRMFGGGNDMVFGSGYLSRRATAWATSQTIIYGDFRYNGNNVYRCTNIGGTTANAPVHGSGIVTLGDGIAWQWVRGNGQEAPFMQPLAGGALQVLGSLQIQAHDAPTTFAKVYCGAGTPLGVVVAPIGSIYLRRDGGAATTLYVKESATDATGWVAK